MLPGSYSLFIDAYDPSGKLAYQDVQELTYRKKKFSCFTRPDKAIYKSGDKVNVDIFCVDSETRPFNPKNGSVIIYDSGSLKIKSFANVEFIKGKFKGFFHLSELAEKGEWSVKFEAEGEVKSNKFKIMKLTNFFHS